MIKTILCSDLLQHDTVRYPLSKMGPDVCFLQDYQKTSVALQIHKYAFSFQPGMGKWLYETFGPNTFDAILKGSTFGPDFTYMPEAKWTVVNSYVCVRDDPTLLRVKLRWA